MKPKYYGILILTWIIMHMLYINMKKETTVMTSESLVQHKYDDVPSCNCEQSASNNNRKILQSFASSKLPEISTLELIYLENRKHYKEIIKMQYSMIHKQNRQSDDAYLFNVSKSDSVLINREIPDTRPKMCLSHRYDIHDFPSVSIIIPFYNEALSMLLRTINSVLRRTPDILLHEIILVDDRSNHSSLLKPLVNYIKLLPKVKLIRNKQRQGLVRSRLYGSYVASASVLIFLDAHTECNQGWLEPILYQLNQTPTAIVQSFIDGINENNLMYDDPVQIFRGAFTWDLRYVWLMTPEHIQDNIKKGYPYFTPVLIGCMIAVTKQYFREIGEFDSGQIIWGGENIELSFRTWMCGGQIITIPCSRVGHMFKDIPYREEINWHAQLQKNYIRVAEVWMDDYKKYFYRSTEVFEARRVNLTQKERSSLETRKLLRKSLQCKTFQWYLDNVVPEIPTPTADALCHGEIVNYATEACWKVLEDDYIGLTYDCYVHRILPQNIFTLDKYGLLRHKDKCVRLVLPTPALKLDWCPNIEDIVNFSMWNTSFARHNVYGILTVTVIVDGEIQTYCVPQVTSIVPTHYRIQMPQVADCKDDNYFQYWAFTYRFDYVK